MKILIIEPECKEWGHEQINAEFLSLISNIDVSNEIVFCAESGHLKNIRKKNESLENVMYQEIELPLNSGDTVKYANKYYKLFEDLIKKDKYSHVFLFSTHKGNLIAIDKIASKYRDIKFNLVLHGVVNQLCQNFTLRQRLRDDKLFHGWGLRYLLNKTCKKENIQYISFGPTMNEYVKNILAEETLSKIKFMHLPYKYDMEVKDCRKSSIIIWVMGGAANNRAKKIISLVDSKIVNDNLCFKVTRSSKTFSGKFKHVICMGDNHLTREQINQEMQNVDYILIPYDESKYRLTSSGILFDAINYEKPFLALDSPLLKWYDDKYHIGICKNSYEELADAIIQISNNSKSLDYNSFKTNIKKCKKDLIEENKKYLQEIIN